LKKTRVTKTKVIKEPKVAKELTMADLLASAKGRFLGFKKGQKVKGKIIEKLPNPW